MASHSQEKGGREVPFWVFFAPFLLVTTNHSQEKGGAELAGLVWFRWDPFRLGFGLGATPNPESNCLF